MGAIGEKMVHIFTKVSKNEVLKLAEGQLLEGWCEAAVLTFAGVLSGCS